MVHPSTPPNSGPREGIWSLENPPTAPSRDPHNPRYSYAPSLPSRRPRAAHRSARALAPSRSSTSQVPGVVKKVKAKLDQGKAVQTASTNPAEEAARLAKLKAQTEFQQS